MRWIREHKMVSWLIAVLLILLIVFVVSLAGAGGGGVSGALNKGMAVVTKPITAITQGVKNTVSGIFSYKQLQEEIEQLEAEKEQLELDLAEANLNREELEELRELSDVLNYDYTNEDFDIVSANISSMDGSNWTNIFTIDKGTESGIEEGSVVISGDGLVGKVSETGKGWSKVVSIIDDGSKVSFKTARNRKLLGVVSGDRQGNITGYMLKSDASITEGDIIITSGMGTYPAGLEIGNIKSITYNSDTLLKEIVVEPAVDFKSLKKVSVIL